MKTEIPFGLKGAQLFKFLHENKDAFIAQKKSVMKRFDGSPSSFSIAGLPQKDGAVKAIGTFADIPDTADVLRVKVAANTSLWCDSQGDVLLRDAGKKSIRERKGLIPHIHDHDWVVGAEVGEVNSIYYEDVPLSTLGVNQAGMAQVLVFDTDIMKAYNEMIFNKYRKGKIKQHSIGLQYVKIMLCMDDDSWSEEYKANFDKYAPMVINQDAISEGYFWAVQEFKLLENSCVLIGANSLTPTLETTAKAYTEDEPPIDTQNQPFDIAKAISNIKIPI
jgi:hypothetical protein